MQIIPATSTTSNVKDIGVDYHQCYLGWLLVHGTQFHNKDVGEEFLDFNKTWKEDLMVEMILWKLKFLRWDGWWFFWVWFGMYERKLDTYYNPCWLSQYMWDFASSFFPDLKLVFLFSKEIECHLWRMLVWGLVQFANDSYMYTMQYPWACNID